MSMFIEGGSRRGRGSRVERLPVSWGEWKRCIMFRRRESITGEQICGWGWMRTEGFFEDPNLPGYEIGQLKQFAKNKKEIFKHKLTTPEEPRSPFINLPRTNRGTRGGRKYV